MNHCGFHENKSTFFFPDELPRTNFFFHHSCLLSAPFIYLFSIHCCPILHFSFNFFCYFPEELPDEFPDELSFLLGRGWLGLRPGWLGLKPGWMAQRGGGRTNERMENLPILQDFVPYRGRCPKSSPKTSNGQQFPCPALLSPWFSWGEAGQRSR